MGTEEYNAEFPIRHRWPDGEYPVVCQVDGHQVYNGQAAWHRDE
jgi:hypothetical protein